MYIETPLESIDPLELLNNEAYRWLHNAILRNFTDLTYNYYFDRNNHELFTLYFLAVYVLKGEEGSDEVEIQGLNDQQRTIILSRINRIENGDSDIIEIPRLYEGEWNTLLETLILKNDTSNDSNILKKNLDYIHQEQFQLESILFAFLNGVENENIENDLNEILNNIANNKLYEFLKLINGDGDFEVLNLLNSLKVYDTNSVRIVKTG